MDEPKDLISKQIIAKWQLMLKNIPCFDGLSELQYQELLSSMQVIEFNKKEIIVEQGQLVDCVYLVVSGKAEVTIRDDGSRKIKFIPIAVLGAGETIGLSDTGFYSDSGKRTATVKAITKLKALKLDITTLNSFLKRHQFEDRMYQATEQLLKMKFIKRSLPFSQISVDRLNWLLENIELKKYDGGSILFKQGDEGNACYLIKSGAIDITTIDSNGAMNQLAILKPPSLFGEATLMTKNKRNATATVIDDSELYVLKHELLQELLEEEEQVSSMFMNLMIDRSRPKKDDHVSIHHRISSDGSRISILKNPENHQYFQLSSEGEYIWSLLDGQNTLQDITLLLSEKFNLFAPSLVAGTISKLAKAKFITNIEVGSDFPAEKQVLWVRGITALFDLVRKRLVLPNADRYVTYLYNKLFKYCFTRTFLVIMLVTAVVGFFAFVQQTEHVVEIFSNHPASWWLLLSIIPLSFLELLLHECGHAFAVKYYKKEVHHMGFALSAVGPVAFTDTSDMWLAPRKARMVVNAAGILVDVLIAGIASMLLMVTEQPYIQCVIWLFVLYTYVGSFRMLSPLYENDGYFLVMDWVEKHHLRKHAVIWMNKKFKDTIKSPALVVKYKAEIIYWLACIVYLLAVSLLTLFLQHIIFAAIGFEPANPYISLIIPFIVVLFTSLNVVAEIKSENKH